MGGRPERYDEDDAVNRGEPSRFAGIAAPAMTVAVRRANAKDLARRRLLESGG
ncbi:Polyketide cyclase / dehydrase and lipid transport [Mycobacterium tuberculosis]|nr:Polyketide cyclase / dehydrase and lipid transport [Mycobacterium tuberculosis]